MLGGAAAGSAAGEAGTSPAALLQALVFTMGYSTHGRFPTCLAPLTQRRYGPRDGAVSPVEAMLMVRGVLVEQEAWSAPCPVLQQARGYLCGWSWHDPQQSRAR